MLEYHAACWPNRDAWVMLRREHFGVIHPALRLRAQMAHYQQVHEQERYRGCTWRLRNIRTGRIIVMP